MNESVDVREIKVSYSQFVGCFECLLANERLKMWRRMKCSLDPIRV